MLRISQLLSIVILLYIKTASGIEKILCFNDFECMKSAVKNIAYPKFIEGLPGVETSDPLHIDSMVADLPTVRYALFNATIIGFRGCTFDKIDLRRPSTYSLFDYEISCPVLTLNGKYEMNGIINSVPLEGEGSCKIVYDNYNIFMTGKHEKVIDDKGKLHLSIEDHIVQTVLNGGVTELEYENLPGKDHSKMLEEMTREVVFDVFMNKLMKNLKEFHRAVPIDELHYKHV